jgi:hypothetical protein
MEGILRKFLGTAALAAGVLCGTNALAKPVITAFDVPGAVETYVSAINKGGDISGNFVGGDGKADGYVRRSDGSFLFFEQAQSFPNAINQSGETAGYTLDSNSDAFVGGADGTVTAFSPKGTTSQFGAVAEAIDAKGNAAGYFTDADFVVHGFLRNRRGHIVPFDAPGGGTASHQGTFAVALTPDGITAGSIVDSGNVYHGFLRTQDGSFTSFDVDGAGTGYQQGTRVLCMSASGTAGGYYVTPDNVQHGFLRDSAGNVATFDGPGALATLVRGISADGTAVGIYTDAQAASHGFERNAKGRLTTIDVPHAGTAQNQGTAATAIDDKGEVAGFYVDSANTLHGFFRAK